MAERREDRSQIFVPAATLPDHYQAAVLAGKLNLDVSARDGSWLEGVDRSYQSEWLKKVWAKTQRINDNWSERRFRDQRVQQADWSIDGMIVDEKGKVVGASVWSTYNSFRQNADLRFSFRDIVSWIQKNNEIAYPFSPKYNTVLFSLDKDEKRVRAAVEKNTGDFKVDDYATSGIKIIRVMQGKKGTMGTGQFAREGITVGKLGFWESPRLALGEFGDGVYVQRVVFRDSPLVPKGAYVTPLDAEQVVARGGKLMEHKYPNVPIIRVNPTDTEGDFIVAALSAERPNKRCPVVLSYTTSRIWLGEGPKHGSGRTTTEPTISHL